jgi:Chaperone of endosialidase
MRRGNRKQISMNPFIQLKNVALVFLVALVCFGLLPTMQAVSPAPDGGYPGGNTAEGQAALLSLTTGGFNTAVGFLSLRSETTGSFNTAIGAGTLLANVADRNTATGAGALLSDTIGSDNTASGAFVLLNNSTGNNNSAAGFEALFSNTTGSDNTANGTAALSTNTTGNSNTATGEGALSHNTTGTGNTADGLSTLSANATGSFNTALGLGAGFNVTTASGVICIGSKINGANVDNTCFIGSIRGVTTQNADAVPVLIDSAGQLGTASSSRRYKTDIKPIDKSSESILALKPVSFRYKLHEDRTRQFGLIAEEVAEANPELVIYDADGKPYTVRYEAVNAMLLNEFLKEHRKNEEQEKTIAELKSGMTALAATVKEQAAQIQKVSAQLEVNKPAPRVVVNKP